MSTGGLGASSRLDQLSPAQRALLEQRLRAREAARASSSSSPMPLPLPLPAHPGEPPVLSFAQERLWLLGEMTPELSAYNTTRVVRLSGPIDEVRFRTALATTIARHEVLRTRIERSPDGRPVARLAPAGNPPLAIVHRPNESTALEAVTEFAGQVFDLENDDLIRALVVRVDVGCDLLAVSLHHIASDEGSRTLLWDDLSGSYAGRQLAPLAGQYSDFARLQRDEFDRPAMAREIDWWRARLAGAPLVLDLPADQQRPLVPSYHGARHRVPLEADLIEALRALQRETGTTLFVGVLAALSWMLRQWGRGEDIVVGMPVSGRDRPEAEGLIGLFVNTVVVRTDCSGAPSFRELLERTRSSVLGGLEHQAVPFEKVVEAVAPQRDVSRNPIFQVLVNAVTSEQQTRFALGELTAEAIDFDPGTTKFDLGVLVAERPDGAVDLVLEYATDLFSSATISDLADELVTLLRAAVTSPTVALNELSALSPGQERRLVYEANETGAAIDDRCLHELISAQALRTPDRTAVADDAGSLTYRELEELTNALAHHLVSLGVGPAVPVAVAVSRSVGMELAVLAILKAGGAYVPLDTSYPSERLAYMLKDCGAPVLVADRESSVPVVGGLADPPVTVLMEDLELLTAGLPTTPPAVPVTPDDLAYIIYTSGSTGKPKGVELRHRGVVSRLEWMQRTFGLGEHDTVLQKTPLSFDVSVWEVLWPLMTGARLFMARPNGHRDVAYLHDVIARERVTLLHFVPSMLAPFVEAVSSLNTSIRSVICSGEALPDEVKEQFFAALPGTELHNLYGPTEASIDVTWSQCLPGPAHRVTIGAPISNVQVYVVDEKRRPLPVGVPGELYLAGVQLARGYVGRPDLTAERFVDFDLAPEGRAYRTGDLVRWTSDGELDYLGRIDAQIKLRGFRIELGEIESVLASHDSVSQASVIVTNAPSGEPMLVAYVALAGNALAPQEESSTQVAEWRAVWEDTYGAVAEAASEDDPYFDISGWTSSFTGEPIPAADMVEWVRATVDRIKGFAGTSLLEIGTGSGLLMWRLAPTVGRYVGTDFSGSVVERLRSLEALAPQPSLTLHRLAADEIDETTVGSPFDTVIANSIVQYFPDGEYLASVLQRSLGLLAPGGRVFVGDVRDLRLHREFALRVEAGSSPAGSAAELLLRIDERCALDAELLVDPRYFAALPGVAHVQVQPKRGFARHEMNCFRYDVVLHADASDVYDVARWMEWTELGGLPALEKLLAQRGADVGVRNIPNARAAAEMQGLAELAAGRLTELSDPAGSIEPEALWDLAESYGYHLELSVLGTSGHLDAAFTQSGRPVRFPPAQPCSSVAVNEPAAARRRALARAAATADLVSLARQRLPEYMVPTVIRVLEHLPLTPNGKLDRAALPPPLELRRSAGGYLAPRTATEEAVAGLWSDVLGIRDIGVEDDFFRLGGHSLLAVRLLASIARSLGVAVALRSMFENPTIAGIARDVDRQRLGEQHQSIPAVDRSGHRAALSELADGASLAQAAAGHAGALAEAVTARESNSPEAVSVFPLSTAQERMWFLDQLDAGKPIYTVRRAYRLSGEPDPAVLGRALDALSQRHDSLRTTVVVRDGVLAAAIADSGHWPLAVADLSAEPDPETAARHAIAAQAAEPFDLAAGPLATASLYRLAPGDAILVLRLHHIIVDGWSMDVLLGELTEVYRALVAGDQVALGDGPLPYPDFALWQRREFDEKALAGQLSYWQQQLSGAPTALELPTDHPRAAVPATRGSRRSATLGGPLTEAVRHTAQSLGTTAFTVLLAGCSALLSRLSGQDDIVFGTAVAGRQRYEIERTIGLFANTLLLRTDLTGLPTFADLLRRCQVTVTEAQSNQDVPFERLVEEMHPDRDLGRNPLFQVMINLQPPAQSGLRLADVALSPYEVDAAFARFDLAFSFVERDGDLHATIDYRSDLYQDSTIEALLERLRALLAAGCEQPAVRICELPIFAPGEQDWLRSHGSNLGAAPAVTTLDLIRRAVEQGPDREAVASPGHRSLTYAELWRQAGILASRLTAKVTPGALIGVSVGRHPGLVVAAVAVWRAGCAYVPLDPSYPQDRLDYMVENSGAALVLDDADLADLAGCSLGAPVDLDPVTPGIDDLAYAIYTSGSTGRPKGVAIEHGALANLLTSMADRPGLGAHDRLLAVTTFSFDIAALELFLPLIQGATVVVADRDDAMDPTRLATTLRESGATVLQATPSVFRMLVDSRWPGSSQLRVFCGGEPLSGELAARLLPLVGEVWNCYGPTETTIWSTVERIVDPDDVTIGRPIANTVAYVLDQQGRLLPPGAQGELWLGGAGVARGYLGSAELTAQRFVPDPQRPGSRIYRTGDLAAWTADGRLRCLGRVDDQIKLRGHRIELGEIEAAIEALPNVSEAAVVLREDREGDPRLVGYVVGRSTSVLDGLRDRLPAYMIPSTIVELEAIPRTLNGKTDRATLPVPDYQQLVGTLPETIQERAVADIWVELLGVETPYLEDDFFALGGHSLLATRLSARASESFGVTIALRSIFEYPTLGAFAAFASAAATDGAAALAPAPPAAPAKVSRDGRCLAASELGDRQLLEGALAGRSASAADAGNVAIFPMSSMQQRMWLLHQMAPDDSRYHVPVLRLVDGPIDALRLQDALAALVARHEILRTTYLQHDELLLQVVQPAASAKLVQHDLSGAGWDAAIAQARADLAVPFDLVQGPVLRAGLIRLGGDRQLLMLCAPHIALDGWSIDHVLGELATLYAGGELQPVPFQFADYAVWERDRGVDLSDQAYWLEKLRGAPNEVTLPLSRPRGREGTIRGRRLRSPIPEDVAQAVLSVARDSRATPFMVMAAAVSAFLSRHGAGDDIVLGTPLATRSFTGSEAMVGALINTLALRFPIEQQASFRSHLDTVATVCSDAYLHGEYPFDRLVSELAVERNPDRHPLFQVLIGMQDARPQSSPFGEASLQPVEIDWQAARYDLALTFSGSGAALELNMEYRADLIDDPIAERLALRFQELLRAAVTDPATRVADLPLLAAGELEELDGWQGRDAEVEPETLPALIAKVAAAYPGRVAVEVEGRSLTFDRLMADSGVLADALRAQGVGAGSIVGMLLGRGIGWAVSALACWQAGAAFVPIDPSYPAARTRFMLQDSGCQVVLTDRATAAGFDLDGYAVLAVDELPAGETWASRAADVPRAATAYVIYTSGSTGTPKGTVISHGALASLTRGLDLEVHQGRSIADPLRVAVNAPVSFDASIQQLLHLGLGATLVPIPDAVRVDPALVVDYLRRYRVDLFDATPTHVRALLAEGLLEGSDGPSMLLVGGEAVDVELWATLAKSGRHAWNVYGPTEVTVDSVVAEMSQFDAPVIGRPLPGVLARVVDPGGRRVPVGVAGELWLAGSQLAAGYLDRPELTAERFVEADGRRWYRTGDVVRYRIDGQLEYLGRSDDQVKVRGHRIELGEVAAGLRALEGVREAAAFARDGELVGCVVQEEGPEAIVWDPTAIRHQLRATLPAYLVPGVLIALKALPLLPNGKVDQALLSRLDASPEAGAREVTPVNGPAEELIAELLRDLLGVEEIGADDDFFDLGGNSLSASRFVAQLRALDIELPLATMFTHTTVRRLAEPLTRVLLDQLAQDDGAW